MTLSKFLLIQRHPHLNGLHLILAALILALAGHLAPDVTHVAHQSHKKTYLKGIDVSHYQGKVNWAEVSRAGIRFAFAKATGGLEFNDPRFAENWQGMQAAGLIRGAYHFFDADKDATAQADHFLATLGQLDARDLPPVLDVETLEGADEKALLPGVLAWLERVEKVSGRKPILYTGLAFGKQYLEDPRLAAYPLWIAEYNTVEKGVPTPWQAHGWSFWQHEQNGTIPGIDGKVDMDLYRGDLEDLQQFIKAGK